MRARGHDPPVLEEDDPVRLVEHERAGADDDRRPTRARLAKPPRDPGLRVGVDRARRLDEHEDLGVREQRASQHDALALAARERAAALLDVAVQPVRQRLEDVLGIRHGDGLEDGRIVRAVPGVELVPERAGEEQRVGLADHDPSPDELDRQLGERHPAEADALALDEPAQPVGERDRVLRPVRDESGEHARRDDEPGAGVRQQRLRGRSGGRRGGIGDQRLDREDVEHPSRADEGPRHLVDGLGGRAEREHEEGGIAVERNELARGDSPVDRETSADPDDDHDEDPGQEHLRGVERRLRQGHPHSREPHLLRAASVAIEEDRLAADSPEHPEAGDRIRAESGEAADLLALLPLTCLQRADHEGEAGDEHGDADEDDETEESSTTRAAGRRRRRRRRSPRPAGP